MRQLYKWHNNMRRSILILLLLILNAFTSRVYSQSAAVENVWIEHGVQSGGETGMRIHAKVTIKGMKGKKARVIAFFYDENKKHLKGGVEGYLTTDNSPYVRAIVDLPYESTYWEDFKLFMPVRAIPLAPGKKTYYVKINVKEDAYDGKRLGNSTYVSFIGTGAQQSVAQKKLPSGSGKYGKRVGTFYFKEGGGSNLPIHPLSLSMSLSDNGIYYAESSRNSLVPGGKSCERLYQEDSQNYYFRRAKICSNLNLDEYYRSGGLIPLKTITEIIDIRTDETSLIIAKDWSNITYVWEGIKYTNMVEIDKEEYSELQNAIHAAFRKMDTYFGRENAPRNAKNSTSIEYQSPSPRHGDVRCSGCGGSGKCTGCAGRGWSELSNGDCAVCLGRGRCGVCYGKGTIHY